MTQRSPASIKKKPLAKYQRVQQTLEHDLRGGKYPAGHRLPPERELAEQFNVSLLTLRQSLSGLEKEGLITRQHGRGTFVESMENAENGSAGDTPIESNAIRKGKRQVELIAYVLIDPPEIPAPYMDNDNLYYRDLLRQVDSEIGKHDRHLIISHSSTADLLAGEYPKAIKSGMVGGIILDGSVTDFHVEVFKKCGLPLLVFGNVPLACDVANIRYDLKEQSYLITKALFSSDKGPVIVGLEPFRVACTHDLFAGYCKACQEEGQYDYVHLFTRQDNHEFVFNQIISQVDGPFCLLLAYGAASTLLSVYRKNNMTLADYPVVVHGSAPFISSESHRRLNVVSETIDSAFVQAGVDVLERMLADQPDHSVTLQPRMKTWQEDSEFRLDVTWHVPNE